MGALITNNPDKVYSLLYKALERLIINRLEDGAFTDEEEVKDVRYYFSTLEGLECLLIPFVNLDKNQFWEPLKNKYPGLKNIIIDDINFILSYNRGQEKPPKEHGYPYFTQRRGRDPYWTSECSSFTLSVLTNFLELRRKFGLPPSPSKKVIEEIIKTNFEWVQLCKKDRGWSWIPEAPEHPWPTWSLLDTFEEILLYPSTKSLFKGFEKKCEEVVENIISNFNDSTSGSYLSEWQEKVVNSKPYIVEKALDLTRLMLAVSLHAKSSDIFPLAQMLFDWASKIDFSYYDYKCHLKERADYIYDSSLIPSIFRTLIIMAEELGPRRIDHLNENLGQSHEVVINKVYSKLTESFINHDKYGDLWGIRDSTGITYELYFTERTIESLTAFLTYYPAEKIGKEISPKVEPPKLKKVLPKKKRVSISTRSDIPNDISKYTVWIPQLVENVRPDALKEFNDWPIEDLSEFYLFRLFNVALALDGAEWGYRERGKSLPDGRLIFPDSRKQCLYDVKSTKGPYNLDIDELRKFKDYAEEGKKRALASQKEVQFFLVIANSFAGERELKEKASKFHSDVNLKLVCMQAKDICSFADAVRSHSTNPSELHLIKWSQLLSKGDPLIESTEYDKIREHWLKDLENL
jgi:hypothetical protein